MAESLKWCEHIQYFNGGNEGFCFNLKYAHNFSPCFVRVDEWNQCPICGTPRPEPKKKSLAQELYEVCWGGVYDFDATSAESKRAWERVADKALSLILDGKEEGVFRILSDCYPGNWAPHKGVAKQILTYLKES